MANQIVHLSRPRTRRHVRTLAALLTLDNSLDQRSGPAKLFRKIVRGLEADLGPEPTMVQRQLCRAFASAALTVEHLTVKLARGEEIDMATHSAALSAMVRIGGRLALKRTAASGEPSLGEYIASLPKDAMSEPTP